MPTRSVKCRYLSESAGVEFVVADGSLSTTSVYVTSGRGGVTSGRCGGIGGGSGAFAVLFGVFRMYNLFARNAIRSDGLRVLLPNDMVPVVLDVLFAMLSAIQKLSIALISPIVGLGCALMGKTNSAGLIYLWWPIGRSIALLHSNQLYFRR